MKLYITRILLTSKIVGDCKIFVMYRSFILCFYFMFEIVMLTFDLKLLFHFKKDVHQNSDGFIQCQNICFRKCTVWGDFGKQSGFEHSSRLIFLCIASFADKFSRQYLFSFKFLHIQANIIYLFFHGTPSTINLSFHFLIIYSFFTVG